MLGISEWSGNETRPKLCSGVLGMSLGLKCSIIHDPSYVGNQGVLGMRRGPNCVGVSWE